MANANNTSIQRISVIVPDNPFVRAKVPTARQCLAALPVEKLMQWWPGKPHEPHRNPDKVRAIQRALDWKRVAQIAAYLLQDEILDASERLDTYFREFYRMDKPTPGEEWPPSVPKVISFQRSEYPSFSNVLLHVNGAKITEAEEVGSAHLVFDEGDRSLNFSVIDGQHRINGAYFALKILQERQPGASWEIPAEIFVDLDPPNGPPQRQAQIFIDVNFNQKKVDRSLVADLFPTARGRKEPLDYKERAQDLGRKLMLEVGPLVGMIQIPGIKFGVKDVVTLATLNSAIESTIEELTDAGIASLDAQARFLAQCLDAWLKATGRQESTREASGLDSSNVAYQGRILVSVIDLVPAWIWAIRHKGAPLISDAAADLLKRLMVAIMRNADLLGEDGKFLSKVEFKKKGYLGSGGIGRFRDALWASISGSRRLSTRTPEEIKDAADKNRARVHSELHSDEDR